MLSLRTSLFAAFLIVVGLAAAHPTQAEGGTPKTTAAIAPVPAVMMIVRLKPGLSDEEMDKVLHERAKLFREVPGLIQKYYVREKETGAYSGVYIWESEEALKAFRASDLAKSIPAAYRVTEPPKVEIYRILFPLRG